MWSIDLCPSHLRNISSISMQDSYQQGHFKSSADALSLSAKDGSDNYAELERSSESGIWVNRSLPRFTKNRKKDLDPIADSLMLTKLASPSRPRRL